MPDQPTLVLCDREILYHGFLCISSIAVIVTQATLLNFYIIAFFRGYKHQVASYFWFLGDLFIVCLVATSCVTAYRFIHLRRKLESTKRYTEDHIQQKIVSSIYKRIAILSPKYCGTLPFSFLSWFIYSTFLTAKIAVIFTSDIPSYMTSTWLTNEDSKQEPVVGLGSNLMKVTIGSSALIFIIMLQAHHNHDPDSPHSGYIAGVCHNTAVEVFDSVTLLAILISKESKESTFLRESYFDKVIIALSSLNLILPSLALYQLSMSDFGRHLERIVPFKVAYQLMHLLLINIPFLAVRIFLWARFNYELSLFVVKNLCYIFMLLHSLYPGLRSLIRRWCTVPPVTQPPVRTESRSNNRLHVPARHRIQRESPQAMEMNTFRMGGGGDRTSDLISTSADSDMEEIALHDDGVPSGHASRIGQFNVATTRSPSAHEVV